MDTDTVVDVLMSNHVPEVTLAVGGLLAVLIAYLYVKDDSSSIYKLAVLLGLIFGAFMALIAFNMFTEWNVLTSVLIILASFTLIIRPFREVHFALLLALMLMIIVYVLLGDFRGTQLEILAEGWYRVGVAFFCGALAYMMLNMLESIVKLIGKFMNAWPVLLLFGMICIAEAIMVASGHGSIYDFIQSLNSASQNAGVW